MRHVLFRRVLVSYLVIAPVLLVSLELYLSSVIKSNYISKLSDNLLIQSRLIAEKIPLSIKGNLDLFCRKYKERTGSRVTIIDSAGRVLGDSDEPSEKMENHLDRPEIQQALISNTGSTVRFSRTIQKDFFYFAFFLDERAEKGFLRLSVPLHDMEREISIVRMRTAIASLTAFLIAVLMGIFQTRRITRSIEEIAGFSRDIRAGNFKARLFLKEKGEIGELAHNINEMAQELKTRLEQSQADKHKMEEILRNMHDGFIFLDIKGNVLICNTAAKKIFGIESDMEGKPLMEILRKAELIDIFRESIYSQKSVVRDIDISHPEELHLVATAVPFYFPPLGGNIAGIMLSLHDTTRLQKLEDMRRDFVANVSHEIKTPITAVKGFAETLLEGAIDDRENALRFLRTIKNHSERLNSLVEDQLTLSRIEFGDIVIDKTVVNLNEVIDNVFATLSKKATEKNIYIKKDIPAGFSITADRNRLIQILLNLVDNGIKFTEKGGVTVSIRNSQPPTPGFIEISIEDTGIGIPRKHLPRLGERFYRVDRSRSRELGGTGLGLAIVKHLVKAHGWEMQIESMEGKGTTVKILIRAA